MNILDYLDRPPYLLRPAQILRRIAASRAGVELTTVRLPWGMPLRVDPKETIGRSIRASGTHDLLVAEAVFRILRSGDVALDVGANIGFMTAAMSRAVGQNGRVLAFEPHPTLYERLQSNIARWEACARVESFPFACSDFSGKATLFAPEDDPSLSGNAGRATLSANGGVGLVDVEVFPLHEFLPASGVKLAKFDVEGHELSALRGAEPHISEHRILNVIFEEHGEFPTPVHQFLTDRGYALFRLHRTLMGPLLLPPQALPRRRPFAETPNYLATLQPGVRELFAARGWRAI